MGTCFNPEDLAIFTKLGISEEAACSVLELFNNCVTLEKFGCRDRGVKYDFHDFDSEDQGLTKDYIGTIDFNKRKYNCYKRVAIHLNNLKKGGDENEEIEIYKRWIKKIFRV